MTDVIVDEKCFLSINCNLTILRYILLKLTYYTHHNVIHIYLQDENHIEIKCFSILDNAAFIINSREWNEMMNILIAFRDASSYRITLNSDKKNDKHDVQ